MKQVIQFVITQEDNWYIAQGVNFPVVTQAESLDALTSNIREATELALRDETPETFGFVPTPTLMMNFEMSPLVYA
jgi:predicted RNase H-like HicB family nuclease